MSKKPYKGIYHKYRDLEWVRLYKNGFSIYEIAAKWHVGYFTIAKVLRFHGINPPRPYLSRR